MDDWETYWSGIDKTGEGSRVFWDNESEQGSITDLRRFLAYFAPELPVLDVGCGNGRQTRFLARHFARVIGVDISPSVIARASAETVDEKNAVYRVFDATEVEAARRLHDEFGDLNAFVRGVLHMIKRRERPLFVQSLEILLGERGTLYEIELPLEAFAYWRTLPADFKAMVPQIAHRVGFSLEDRARYFRDDRWTVLEESRDVIIRTIHLSDDREAEIPANYFILRRKSHEH
jgi:SAM-dependent methyltransferase